METLRLAALYVPCQACTDPTYKEWKHFQISDFCKKILFRTDPTYKEWKLPSFKLNNSNWLSPHGSYLQGMETGSKRGEPPLRLQARILPTRNGNHTLTIIGEHGYPWARILPTRNGN